MSKEIRVAGSKKKGREDGQAKQADLCRSKIKADRDNQGRKSKQGG